MRGSFQWILILMMIASMLLISCASDTDENSDDGGDAPAGDDDDDDDDDDNDNNDDDDDTEGPLCDSGKRIEFDLSKDDRNVPYPSVIFTKEDSESPTGILLDVEGQVATYLDPIFKSVYFLLDGLNQLNGFGVGSPVWMQAVTDPDTTLFPDSIDPDDEDSIYCVVLEDESHPYYGTFWPLSVSYMPDVRLLQIAPYFPFVEDTTYACVVTDKLLTDDGDCYQPTDHLWYIMSDEPDTEQEEYDLLEPYRQQLYPMFAELFEQVDLTQDQIVNATFFHTQTFTSDLVNIREQTETMAIADPPQVGDWILIDSGHEDYDSIWETTYETPDWRKKGIMVYDAQGNPEVQKNMTVTMRLTLPPQGAGGYDPPYPVVLYGHGISDDRGQSKPLARSLTEYGIATVAIDWVFHGERSQGLENLPDFLVNVVRTVQFVNFFELLKLRDNMRQGVADMIWLKHVVRTLDGLDLAPFDTKGDGLPDLDTETLFYAGMSLGSIHGGIIAAIEPDFEGLLLNVGAADWRKIALEGAVGEEIQIVLWLLDMLIQDTLESDVYISFELARPMIDAGDPYSYGRYVIKEPLYDITGRTINILQQMAAYDDTLGGPGSAQMARSMGLALMNPYVFEIDDVEVFDTPYQGPAVFMYDTDEHTMMLSSGAEFYDEVHLQAGTFFRTIIDDGVATIINPLQ